MQSDDTTGSESAQGAEEPSGLRAIWANTLEPVAPLPWYRRVPRNALIAAGVVVGLFAAVTVAAVTGFGAPTRHRIVLADRIGDQVRLPDDDSVLTLRADYERQMTALRPYRELTVAGYGAAGSTETTLTVIGLTGSFPDVRRELDKYFGTETQTAGAPSDDPVVVGRQDYPAGPLGGALDCAVIESPAASLATCAWADGNTVGIVVDETGAGKPGELARRTLDIRAAVEVEEKD
ncbi:hypothetical protein ACFVXH_10505 [Kitasatospora sp. NPDC058184]|uniref:hypothetical protein n=1 Tax=Kitasatospora sp. NPDC058184 TaxID=3346370 RepID=UPI0036DBDD67